MCVVFLKWKHTGHRGWCDDSREWRKVAGLRGISIGGPFPHSLLGTSLQVKQSETKPFRTWSFLSVLYSCTFHLHARFWADVHHWWCGEEFLLRQNPKCSPRWHASFHKMLSFCAILCARSVAIKCPGIVWMEPSGRWQPTSWYWTAYSNIE